MIKQRKRHLEQHEKRDSEFGAKEEDKKGFLAKQHRKGEKNLEKQRLNHGGEERAWIDRGAVWGMNWYHTR